MVNFFLKIFWIVNMNLLFFIFPKSLEQLQDFHPRPKTAYPSTQRWMQYAGAQGIDTMADLFL